ncbi:MAG: hypothetical protein ABSB32_19345, partial [Thermodesulfobacteriota bacterium]
TCSLDRAHARVIPCFIAFGDPVFIRSAELSGIQRAFFIKGLKGLILKTAEDLKKWPYRFLAMLSQRRYFQLKEAI